MKAPIKQWNEDDRPREKLISKGVSVLSNSELLAIIIGSGSKEDNALEIAHKIFSDNQNSINELCRRTIKDFTLYKGIGKAKAVNIVATLEISRRRQSEMPSEKPKIQSSKDAYNLMSSRLEDLTYEEFWAVYLNRNNQVIGTLKIGQGGISETAVDIRLIIKEGLMLLCSSIILFHNHPSGNINPSEIDNNITQKIKAGANFLSINITDHLIIAGKKYYSFTDEGKI